MFTFLMLPISSWNFWRADWLITFVLLNQPLAGCTLVKVVKKLKGENSKFPYVQKKV
jgi:hypothetical protein